MLANFFVALAGWCWRVHGFGDNIIIIFELHQCSRLIVQNVLKWIHVEWLAVEHFAVIGAVATKQLLARLKGFYPDGFFYPDDSVFLDVFRVSSICILKRRLLLDLTLVFLVPYIINRSHLTSLVFLVTFLRHEYIYDKWCSFFVLFNVELLNFSALNCWFAQRTIDDSRSCAANLAQFLRVHGTVEISKWPKTKSNPLKNYEFNAFFLINHWENILLPTRAHLLPTSQRRLIYG